MIKNFLDKELYERLYDFQIYTKRSFVSLHTHYTYPTSVSFLLVCD